MPTGIYLRTKKRGGWKIKDTSNMKGHKISEITREKMRINGFKRKQSQKTKDKMREIALRGHYKPPVVKGKNFTMKHKFNLSLSHFGKTGTLASNWQGGKTEESKRIRNSLEYKLWRTAVFERDNYQCIWGGKEHGNKLQADHIKQFAFYPELRFAIDNGRTLCIDCHRKTFVYYKKL